MPPVTLEQLARGALRARPLRDFRRGLRVRAASASYVLAEPPGANFAEGFAPRYTPGEMLRLGVFEGRYLNDRTSEFPREWFLAALAAGKLSPEQASPGVNLFGVKSRKGLSYWRAKGWIPLAEGDPDERGWFQWYCRYWLGRRLPELDRLQIARWRSFARHAGQIRASYRRMASPPRTRAEKMRHRPRQRQALLQWAHDPWV